MKRNRLIWFFSLLFCCTLLAAQKVTVEGTVTGFPDSEVLMGASVSVKGTTQGTITDLDGKYSLSVASDATLVFSYLGYETKEVAVKNRSLINVSLKADAQDLEEVVVVGTILKKSDLTGAVSSVSAKVLEEKPVTNINQALQGRVAGVFISNAAKPGDDATIKIRGINTINGSTDPIYVIDGQVMDNFGGGFNSVNLNDVASIEVLKDASATALYGSRASNGVILVTTKKGKNGIGKVTYDGWVGFQTDAKLPKTMGTKDLFELRKDAAMNSFTARHPGATEDEINAFLNNRVMKPYSKDGSGGYVFAQYEFDAYIVGSDQVWRWAYNAHIEWMYLSFVKDESVKRIAYAASIGIAYWDYPQDKSIMCATLAQQFNAISVREKDAVSLVKEYLGMPAQYVLDPTLLLNATDYEQLLLLGPVKPDTSIAVYILDMTENKRLLLDDLQKRLHCKINVIGNPDAQNSSFSYRDRQSPPVEDWLNGIRKADYVLTDSFHGTVFSIIFHK